MNKPLGFQMKNSFLLDTGVLLDLATSNAEKDAMSKFGLPVIHDAEISALMEEVLSNQRKEAVRAAVKEIITVNQIADKELRQQFDIIKHSNRAIAAARERSKNIALARAYGAETRNYIPLLVLLNIPVPFDTAHQRTSIPEEWIKNNKESVLNSFKEQGQVAAEASKKENSQTSTKKKK